MGWGGGWCLPVITFFAAQEASCLPVHDTGSGAGFFPGVIIFNEAGDQLVGELRGKGVGGVQGEFWGVWGVGWKVKVEGNLRKGGETLINGGGKPPKK